MSGICGLIGVGAVRDRAAAMAKRLYSSQGANEQHAVLDDAAVFATSAVNGAVYIAGGVTVAICGRPSFDTAAASDVGRKEGPGAAVVALYRDHGERFLEHVRGSFALVLVDVVGGTTILAIDRAGIETLCYSTTRDGLSFASNLDALAAGSTAPPQIEPQSVFDYLFFHVVPAPETIYRSMFKLLPGQCVVVRNGQCRPRFYWQLAYHETSELPEDEAAEGFRDLVGDSVRRAAGPNAGSFLSGGTDSSTVTGYLAQVRQNPVDAYSIGFNADGFDETEYARIAARRFGVRHHEYYLTPEDVVQAVPLLAATFDEPFGNASAVPAYQCALLARADGIASMLAGDGGDEIFGGNARYAKQKVFEIYGRVPRLLRSAIVEPLILGLPGGDRMTLTRKAASYIRQARIPLPDRLESYNFLARTPLSEVFNGGFLESISTTHPDEILREPYHRASSRDVVDRMMHLDLKLTLADNDLRKVVGACRCAGVEARFPLLDDALIEFSGTLPADWKVRGAQLRYFFKRALKDFLPPEILAKSKHGFGLPFGLWMHEYAPLRELAGDSLQSFRSRGILRDTYIDSLLSRHEQEDASYYGVMIWVVMMLEQWLASHPQSQSGSRH